MEIWKVQINLHGRDASNYDLEELLSKATDGWTGAEIEALYNEGLYSAFDAGKEPDIRAPESNCQPRLNRLARLMAADIEVLEHGLRGVRGQSQHQNK